MFLRRVNERWWTMLTIAVGIYLSTLGLVIISLSVFSFSFLQRDANTIEIIGRQILMGVGIAFFSPANNSAIIGALPSGKVGLASSFLALSRNLGMAVGVAFAEMVISLRSAGHPSDTEPGAPTLEALQGVWRSALLIGGGGRSPFLGGKTGSEEEGK